MSEPPEIELEITEVPARARKLRTVVTVETQEPFEDSFGTWTEPKERSAVDRLSAVGEGKPDPGRWVVSPEEAERRNLPARMAKEMVTEIDAEILGELRNR